MSRYAGTATATGDVVVRDVTVIDPVAGQALGGRDVRLRAGVVTAVEATGAARDDDGTHVVDGHGRFLCPGLVDMHAHALNTPDDVDGAYALMLACGVVGFRQMSGSPALLGSRRDGALPAPNGAPALLATPGELLTPMNAATPQTAVATVREQHQQGADFIKVAFVGREAFLATLEEGRRIGLPVAGHLPATVDPHEAAALGMRCIEHLGPGVTMFAAASRRGADVRALTAGRTPTLPRAGFPGMSALVNRVLRGIVLNPATRTTPSEAEALHLADSTFDPDRAEQLAAHFVAAETWQCPTLVRVHTQQFPHAPEHHRDPRRRYIAPDELRRWDASTQKFLKLPARTRDALEQHWAAQLQLTRTFAAAGVPMLAGSDANGAAGVIPGFALHDEFDLLARAGLDPLSILRTTTSAPARFLGTEDHAGRVAPGYEANLVLLTEDPLQDHAALHAVEGTVRNGDWWDRAALDLALAAVARNPGAR